MAAEQLQTMSQPGGRGLVTAGRSWCSPRLKLYFMTNQTMYGRAHADRQETDVTQFHLSLQIISV